MERPSPLSRDVDTLRPAAADFGFPSPASEDISLATPSLDGRASSTLSSAFPFTPATAAVAPVPQDVQFPSVQSPQYEIQSSSLEFDTVVGASVDPVSESGSRLLPTTSLTKAGPGFRLPFFTLLGIAPPSPADLTDQPNGDSNFSDSLRRQPDPFDSLLHGDPSSSSDALLDGSDGDSRTVSPALSSPRAQARLIHNPLHQYVTTITPPDDSGKLIWDSISTVATGAMDSPATDSGTTSTTPETSAVAGSSSTEPQIRIERATPMEGPRSWLNGAIEATLTNLQSAEPHGNPLKVLSHALPIPSTEGHAFPAIIDSLHNQTPSSPTCWINVFHALPGRFNLADLPTSPPSTPGQPYEGDDYFTSKVFDSAVPVLDYQENVQSLPQTPRPVVPPSSVNVAIVERYIPPTNSNEFAEMFSTNGPSLLVDRLAELSPSNGTLIFIYPTKRGAETFVNDYLGPILDPLLRSMVIINGLSADFSGSLGRMAAVDSMMDHATLRRKITILCTRLSQHSSRLERLHGRRSTFSLEYSSKEEVMVDRKIWASDWWMRQEKPRVKEAVTSYFRKAQRPHGNADITPTNLLHQVLDGVASRPYGDRPAPARGIEVSVFVIRRSV